MIETLESDSYKNNKRKDNKRKIVWEWDSKENKKKNCLVRENGVIIKLFVT